MIGPDTVQTGETGPPGSTSPEVLTLCAAAWPSQPNPRARSEQPARAADRRRCDGPQRRPSCPAPLPRSRHAEMPATVSRRALAASEVMLINARKSGPAASALSRDRFAPRLRPATIAWLLDIEGVSLNPCKVMTSSHRPEPQRPR